MLHYTELRNIATLLTCQLEINCRKNRRYYRLRYLRFNRKTNDVMVKMRNMSNTYNKN